MLENVQVKLVLLISYTVFNQFQTRVNWFIFSICLWIEKNVRAFQETITVKAVLVFNVDSQRAHSKLCISKNSLQASCRQHS